MMMGNLQKVEEVCMGWVCWHCDRLGKWWALKYGSL